MADRDSLARYMAIVSPGASAAAHQRKQSLMLRLRWLPDSVLLRSYARLRNRVTPSEAPGSAFSRSERNAGGLAHLDHGKSNRRCERKQHTSDALVHIGTRAACVDSIAFQNIAFFVVENSLLPSVVRRRPNVDLIH
jgi:hypothetical protein